MLSSLITENIQGEHMVNKAILVGRLGKDPETRFTPGGQGVCNFSLATDETFKDKNGERQKRTEWHRVVVWGKLAEICQQYLKKGTMVYVEGRIQSRSWDDKTTGQKRYSTDIVANVMRMLSSRGDGAGASAGGGFAGGAPHSSEGDFSQGGGDDGGASVPGPEISDEDIPF
jgi:single-strand DNA-binding protein